MTPEREKEIRDYLAHPWDQRNDGKTYRDDVNLGRELLAEIDSLRERNIHLSNRVGERTRMVCDLRSRLCKIDEAVKKNVGGAW